ncbi:sulfatase-like hydrolase/transferase [uncultured Lutibacter sp.]|uniref:sulfatase-like hydrolase/transferase n=1 Tax=uncultured Lutibacter sp. TaxID=437739 RepID=UPI00261DC617|nr:sulfatase-like hydrolase/transferase [uncultured Lutibacter sp.]
MKSKLAILLLAIICFSCVEKQQEETTVVTKSSEKPNIIVVLTDDQGWADVGFNGCTDIPTPNLDKMAGEGVIFSNGYVSHPYCSPSRAGLLTGRYQARFGHDCNMPYDMEGDATVGTPLSEKMMPEAFKELGYRTSAIGKWHLGDHEDLWPPAQGFDHWFGFPGGGMNFWGISKNKIQTIYRDRKAVPEDELTYLTDDFTDEAIDFITKKDDKPFFMYLAYNAPHAPDHATKQYLEKTKHIEYAGRSIYGAMVNGVDHSVGRIDSTLVANGMKDNTVIVYLSDNGGRTEHADNRPYRGHKGMLFEGGIKVPFYITYPNGIKPNQVYDEPVISLDLFPTLLNLAGGDASKETQLEGKDLLPFINKEVTNKPHEIMFWRSVGGFEYAVRKGNFKLYKSSYKNKTLLFDLEKDSYERHDISDKHPKIMAELELAYKEWDSKNIPPQWFDPHAENVLKEEKRFQTTRNRALRPKAKK